MGSLPMDDEHVPSHGLDQDPVSVSLRCGSLTFHQDYISGAASSPLSEARRPHPQQGQDTEVYADRIILEEVPPYSLESGPPPHLINDHVLPSQSEQVTSPDSALPTRPLITPRSDPYLPTYLESLNSPIHHATEDVTTRTPHRPSFAIDTPLKRFTQLSSLPTPAKSFLINKPFVGPYYPPSTPNGAINNTIALAVYARYDFASDRMWIAIRQIHITPTGRNRQYKTKWMRFDEFCNLAEAIESIQQVNLPAQKWQLFVPRKECCWLGFLDECRLMVLWDQKNVLGWDGFEG